MKGPRVLVLILLLCLIETFSAIGDSVVDGVSVVHDCDVEGQICDESPEDHNVRDAGDVGDISDTDTFDEIFMMADENRDAEIDKITDSTNDIENRTTSIPTVISSISEITPVISESTTTEEGVILVSSTAQESWTSSEETTTVTTRETTTVTTTETTTETTTVTSDGTTTLTPVSESTTTPPNSENAVEEDEEGVELVENASSTTEADARESSTVISPPEDANKTKEIALQKVNKLSDQVRLVLEQYKKSGSVVIPNVPIPDPMSIPEINQRVSMASMNFKNMSLYGLSNFTVQHINTDLEKMQVYVMLKMARLIVKGNYTMRTFLTRASGPFTVIMTNVTTEGAAELRRNGEGQLEAAESDMNMFFDDIFLDFKNLGFMGTFFQGIMGSVGGVIFDSIKPFILEEVNTNMRADVNKKIRAMSVTLKMSDRNPVDQAVFEGRRYVRDQGYDPYHLQNYTRTLGLFTLNITEFNLQGLSRFYRVGEVSLSMDSGTVEAGLRVATDGLNGSCVWSFGVGNKLLRKGKSIFSVNHFQVRGIVQQSLNLSNPPILHDLDILLGKIELKTQKEDTIDYLIETVVNNLPSLLRHIIVDGLEEPMKVRGQQILNQVDVQSLVDENLSGLDNLGV